MGEAGIITDEDRLLGKEFETDMQLTLASIKTFPVSKALRN
jgi:hypothetical protein